MRASDGNTVTIEFPADVAFDLIHRSDGRTVTIETSPNEIKVYTETASCSLDVLERLAAAILDTEDASAA